MSAGLPWSISDDKALITSIKSGMSHKDIARLLERSTDAVSCRITALRKEGIHLPPCKSTKRQAHLAELLSFVNLARAKS